MKSFPTSNEVVLQFTWQRDDNPVTKRESQILDLISLGLSTIEIAKSLYISTETVKTHRRKLFQKIGAVNCAQLIRRSIECGVLEINSKIQHDLP